MKKSSLLLIIIFIIAILVLTTFCYSLIYFKTFNKKLRPATDVEKQKVIELMKEKMGYEESQIKIGNIFSLKDRDFVQVEIVINNSKKYYLVDPINGEVIRK